MFKFGKGLKKVGVLADHYSESNNVAKNILILRMIEHEIIHERKKLEAVDW